LSEFIEDLPTVADFGVQAVEKSQNPAKFGKRVSQNKGTVDGQILQPKCHGCHQLL
jgi:hypothetical protein